MQSTRTLRVVLSTGLLALAASAATWSAAAPTAEAQYAEQLGSPVRGGYTSSTPRTEPQAAEPEEAAQEAETALPDPTASTPPDAYGTALPPPPDGPRYPVAQVISPARAGLSETGTLGIPSAVATRMRAIDADLQILAARGGGSIVDGVLSILTGGLSITLGILINGPISPYLYLYGGAGAVRGILDLALMTNPAGSAVTYTHMPMTTVDEVRARLRYGEHELEHLASMAQLSRILDGSINIATGLAIIPVYLGPINFAITDPFDYFVLIGAGISAVSGIITLFSSTEAERRWGAYQELRDRLRQDGHGDEEEIEFEAGGEGDEQARLEPTFDPGVSFSSAGGMVSIRGTF